MALTNDPLSTIQIDGFVDRFFLTSVRGRETLGQPYEFVVAVACDTVLDEGEIEDLMKNAATLYLGPQGTHPVRGLVREVRVAPEPATRKAAYLLVIVPRLWFLSQTLHSRVYLQKELGDILGIVLRNAGVTALAMQLRESRAVRPFTVQYEETDLDFLHRWIERDGITYHFAHDDAVEVLCLSDSNDGLGRDAHTLEFRGTDQQVHESVWNYVVSDIQATYRVTPVATTERDWFTTKPSLISQVVAPQPGEWPGDRPGDGAMFHFGDLQSDAATAKVAQMRREMYQTPSKRFRMKTNTPAVRAGHKITVWGHPIASMNGDFLVVSADHMLDQEGMAENVSNDGRVGYENELECIPIATVWRAPRSTPWPRIRGIMHAIVDEPAHDATMAAQTPENLYWVHLPFDENSQPNRVMSIPVRRAQPFVGPGYGQHFPLHLGTGVILAFVDGDPDRPVIVGAVHDQVTPEVPEVVPTKMRGAIRTRSGVVLEYDDDA
ncbi:MAG: type VI secretion system tip protein VgrG [Myxococcales bacterium]|nr:type VI secretion system tip protein VgrG [Myxococcales bacterium]